MMMNINMMIVIATMTIIMNEEGWNKDQIMDAGMLIMASLHFDLK